MNLLTIKMPFYRSTWKYSESFLVGFAVLLIGAAIEFLTGSKDIRPIGAPYNIYIACAYIALLIFLHVAYTETPVVKWLSSIPAAISAIILFSLLVFLLGFIPQHPLYNLKILNLTGLLHIKTSWPFLLIQVYLLTILGMVTIRRFIPFKGRNIGFFLNHFGLWLIILAGCLGVGDLKRFTINLLEKELESNIGLTSRGELCKLPFTLKLIDFTIEEYNPKLDIIDSKTGQSVVPESNPKPEARKGARTIINDWVIEVNEYFSQALIQDSIVQSSTKQGNYPAAYIKAINTNNHDTVKGWISNGSYLQDPLYMSLKGDTVLSLTTPEAKKYSSLLEIRNETHGIDTITVEVNKPLKLDGWTIYQAGYDQSKGKWSSLGIFEAVNDPWLPVMYAGIGLLLIGSVFLFWGGKRKPEDPLVSM